jgi:hypothetical protein
MQQSKKGVDQGLDNVVAPIQGPFLVCLARRLGINALQELPLGWFELPGFLRPI